MTNRAKFCASRNRANESRPALKRIQLVLSEGGPLAFEGGHQPAIEIRFGRDPLAGVGGSRRHAAQLSPDPARDSARLVLSAFIPIHLRMSAVKRSQGHTPLLRTLCCCVRLLAQPNGT
jgi:hypothetical protein